ncbi:MAG: hypothetical protein EBX39_12275 [Actinobacteria bacterium]|nr:hypothetical protein [Actinomycetota bacterium]
MRFFNNLRYRSILCCNIYFFSAAAVTKRSFFCVCTVTFDVLLGLLFCISGVVREKYAFVLRAPVSNAVFYSAAAQLTK